MRARAMNYIRRKHHNYISFRNLGGGEELC